MTSVEQLAFFSVDVADVGGTTGCAHEAWVVGEHVGFAKEGADVDQGRT